ncbi:discoidin domain-containing protein [Paenibacillus sp. GCM10027627]|uniref:discoidin domain-containing protein n=1 Tax=unclassified Paenibacillus TaxID=185978 RepID=UPI003627D7CF
MSGSNLKMFDCGKAIQFNYFKQLGLPVEALLFNAYQSIDDIFKQTIVDKKQCWEFVCETLDDLRLLEMVEKTDAFPDFESGFSFVQSSLSRNKPVFFSISKRYLPHYAQFSQEGAHFIQLNRYDEITNEFELSDDLHENMKYDYSIISNSYNHSDIENKYMITYETDMAAASQAVEKTNGYHHLYKWWMANLTDNTEGYAYLLDKVQDPSLSAEEIIPIEQFMDVVASSRYLTSVYLQSFQIDGDEASVGMLLRISKLAEVIKNKLVKARIVGSLSGDITSLFNEMLQLESYFLRSSSSQSPKSDTLAAALNEGEIGRPGNVNYSLLNETDIVLTWEDALSDLPVIGYDIFNHSVLVEQVSTNSAKIKTEPSRHNSITITAKNIFGRASEPSDTLHIEIPSTFVDLALRKPAFSSSDENMESGAANAVDGNSLSRWSSSYRDGEWIYVDLEQDTTFAKVLIVWESAFASKYRIQSSLDRERWTDLAEVKKGQGGIEEFGDLNGSGRYVRLLCEERSTEYGSSLYQFSVFK